MAKRMGNFVAGLTVVGVIVVVAGAHADETAGTGNSTVELPGQAVARGLRSRMKLTGLRRSPQGTSPKDKFTIDRRSLVRQFEEEEEETAIAILDDGRRSEHKIGKKTLHLDRTTGVVMVDDSRGYKEDSPGSRRSDAALVVRAKEFVSALGGVADDAMYDARALMGRRREEGTGKQVVEEIARKVFVKRVVAGYPVDDDRLVVSFTPGGELRRVRGRWHEFDSATSRFNVMGTEAAITDEALFLLEEKSKKEKLSFSDKGDVKIHTALTAVDDGTGKFSLQPFGRLEVPIVTPTGETYMGIDFPL